MIRTEYNNNDNNNHALFEFQNTVLIFLIVTDKLFYGLFDLVKYFIFYSSITE